MVDGRRRDGSEERVTGVFRGRKTRNLKSIRGGCGGIGVDVGKWTLRVTFVVEEVPLRTMVDQSSRGPGGGEGNRVDRDLSVDTP